MSYTENLSDFGHRETEELENILRAKRLHGLPDDFSDDNVRPAFDTMSGYVFLTNDDCQVCMYDDESGQLFSFYSSPYEGHEGSFEELLELYRDGQFQQEDNEWFIQIAENINREDELTGDDDLYLYE